MNNIHDLAREYLSKPPGLNLKDTQKKAVFEFADWLHQKDAAAQAKDALADARRVAPESASEIMEGETR